MKEWKQRCGVAMKVAEDIGSEKLRGLLGERWEQPVGLGAIKAREQDGQRQPLGDLVQGKGASNVVETGAGKKVVGNAGPEIIDLDCE